MGPINTKIFTFFLSLLSLMFLSCSTDKKVKEELPAPDSLAVSESQLLQMGMKQLVQWTRFWESKGAGFDREDFQLHQQHQYERVEWPEENPLSGESPLREYQLPNPGSKGVVDIYNYKIVVDADNQVNFNTDSEVVYYKKNGMRERLLFIGPSGVFEDAAWINEDHLLVSGHLQKENGFVPIIWLVFPDSNKYAVYENRFSTKDYSPESYLKAKLENLRF